MIGKVLAVLPVAAAVAVLAGPAAFADTTPVASIAITAEPGSYPVTASGHWAAPDQEVLVSSPQNVLKAQTDNGLGYIAVLLRGPHNEPLHVGSYDTVGDPQAHPELASVQLISNGLGCYAEQGGFTVDRIETDPASGVLTAFDGTFDQRCAGSTGTAHGEIHFQR
ncbi:hypothetical protein [Kutzneria sp. CA-103260]|uniref:hypothetical protein n=1 Tax=Kutzneria sp. CA-103260 TaxID=2802641 RepID=UPI001BAA261B|nr:hypothetical protein [Kutzneria sp. CA-103260]QUQ66264.1 hypothetical protein JJ691_39910 [Kutzneria sp. CA-103260]